MTLELFIWTADIQLWLAVCIILMAYLPYRNRGPEARLIGFTGLLHVGGYLSILLIQPKGKDVNTPQNIEGILFFLTLAYLYFVTLRRLYAHFFKATVALFLTFALFNILFWQKNDLNTYSLAVRSFFILIYCILYWYRLLIDLPVSQLQRLPMFWYNTSFLIYTAGTLFLFLFYSYFVEVLHNDMLTYWTFHNILSIVQHLVIMIGLWQDLRNIKSRSSLPSVP